MLEFLKGKVIAKDWAFVAAVLVATVVLASLIYFVIVRTQQTKAEDQKSNLSAKSKELAEAMKIERNIGDLRKDEEKMRRLVGDFQKRLPDEREIPNLLSQFEKTGNEIGLKLQMAPLPESTEGQVETIPFKITATGKFHQIVAFINLLERDQRYLKVSDIDIGEEKRERDAPDAFSQATFVLSTYRFLASPDQPENRPGGAVGGQFKPSDQNSGKSAANGPAK